MARRFFDDFPPLPRLLPGWTHSTFLVLVVATVVRLGTGIALHQQLKLDPDGYALLSRNLAQFEVLGAAYVGENQDGEPVLVRKPSAYRPPLYPLLLRLTCLERLSPSELELRRKASNQPALVSTHRLVMGRVIALHVVLGVMTTVLVWRMAVRCRLGAWGMAAVMATMFDPLLINQASLIMTETLAAFLVALSLWFLMRRKERGDSLLQEMLDERDEAENAEAGDSPSASAVGSSDVIEIVDDDEQDESTAEAGADTAEADPTGRTRFDSLRRHARRQVKRSVEAWRSMRWPTVFSDEYFWLPQMHLDVAAGLALGLAALCRPSFLAWIGLIVLLEGVRRLYHWQGEGLVRLMVMCVTILVVLSPWIIRNAKHLGKATPTTTHGGYTLMLGNNPDFYRHLRESPGTVWDAADLDADVRTFVQQNKLTEIEADQDAYGRAFNAMAEHPQDFLYSCLLRFGRFWSPMPHKLGVTESWKRKLIRWGSSAWYDAVLVLMLLGMTVAARRRLHGPWLEGFLLIFAMSIVHTFYWSNMRMRAPLTPFIAMLVALGLMLVCSREDALTQAQSQRRQQA